MNLFIRIFSLITTLAIFAMATGFAQAQSKLEPATCGASQTPLFGSDSLVKIDILSDMETYLSKGRIGYERMRAPGIVSIEDENHSLNFAPIRFETRGNSRFIYCEYKPIRLSFLNTALEEDIENQVGPYIEDKTTYLKKYKDLLDKLYTDELVPESQPTGMFSSIGDDVKIVTHCGKSSWDPVGGDTPLIYNDRLLGEYLSYQIVGALESVTMRTRMAEITYRNADGSVIDTFWGFFRENPSSLAKRCGLLKKAGSKPLDTEYRASEFHAEFINELIYNKDYGVPGHNVKILYRDHGASLQSIYLPYDFDLNGIIVPDYFKNQGPDLKLTAGYFSSWVKAYADRGEDQMAAALATIRRTLLAEEQIQALIEASDLSPKMKTRFQEWQSTYFAELKTLETTL